MAIRTLLRTIGIRQHSESSLPSYLLFEQHFTKALIDIGYQDAMRQIDDIVEFLGLDPADRVVPVKDPTLRLA